MIKFEVFIPMWIRSLFSEVIVNVIFSDYVWGKSSTLLDRKGRGSVTIQADNNYPNWGHVCDLCVVEWERRKGIGSALMVKSEEIVKECFGLNEVRLDVERYKDWMVEWYKKLGYEVINEYGHYYTMRKVLEVKN